MCASGGTAWAQDAGGVCGQASPSGAPCTGAEKLAEAAAAECRRLGLPEERCALPLGHRVSSRMVRAYRRTWLHRAAAFQYRLGDRLPLLRAQWLGTHNSFNSVNEERTISHGDSNQQLSLTQQLDIDVRSLELDLHLTPRGLLVCHGRGPEEQHLGCTTEPRFSEVLPKIRDWLLRRPRQVVLLYLEDDIGGAAGYAETIRVLDAVLRRSNGSSMVYRPSPSERAAKGCADLPLGISRNGVRARGAQVILVGKCRSGWASRVYGWDDNHVESGSTPDYRPFPACDSTYPRSVYDSKLVRYYEDSTFVSSAVEPTRSPAEAEAQALRPARVASMVRCGVNLFGFDQLLPNDGRIRASIWSWAKGEPDRARGRCALRGRGGRWVTRPCRRRHRAACRTAAGWKLTPRAVRHRGARRACRASGGRFGLPRTGFEASRLSAAAGKRRAWVRYVLR